MALQFPQNQQTFILFWSCVRDFGLQSQSLKLFFKTMLPTVLFQISLIIDSNVTLLYDFKVKTINLINVCFRTY